MFLIPSFAKYTIKIFYILFSFSTMYECWREAPDERPAFEDLATALGRMLESVVGYLELGMILQQGIIALGWVY